MADNYTAFNLKKSNKAQLLLREPDRQLFRRYLLPLSNNDKETFRESFISAINMTDKEGYQLYPYICTLEGENLDYINKILFSKASIFARKGYKINANEIVKDFDDLLFENEDKIKNVSFNTPVLSIVQEITEFLTNEILTNKVYNVLQTGKTSSF